MDHYQIKWNDSLSVADEMIDAQHQHLIELIGAIPEYTTSNDEDVLAEALAYANQHFSEEEQYMKKINYPGYEAHKRLHKKLVRVLAAYKKDYENGEADLYHFKQFMFQWVKDHIMDEDRKIGQFVNKAN